MIHANYIIHTKLMHLNRKYMSFLLLKHGCPNIILSVAFLSFFFQICFSFKLQHHRFATQSHWTAMLHLQFTHKIMPKTCLDKNSITALKKKHNMAVYHQQNLSTQGTNVEVYEQKWKGETRVKTKKKIKQQANKELPFIVSVSQSGKMWS